MSAGDTTYFGFEYQLYASVFLMLIEHQNLTFSEMIVETPFGNDAAIQSVVLPSPNLELEERELSVSLIGGSIIKQIQVKTKARHYLWRPSEFREVLLKEDENNIYNSKSQTVLDHLASNPQEIFIFFTDGVVHPDIASLRSDPINLCRKQPHKPVSLAADSIIGSTKDSTVKSQLQELKNGLLERVFIIESLDIEILKTKICQLIYKTYNFPYHHCIEKMIRLVDLVRQRMLREGTQDKITKSELEEIIGSPSPQAPYADLIDKFVPTNEYARTLETLEQKHIAIICGEPCVGKTTMARAVVNTYFERNYELALLDNNDAHLHIAKACINHEMRIFLLDDGLGIINYESQFALADQLPQLVSQISNAKGRVKLIVTTRRNVLAEAKNASRLGDINIDHYTIDVPPPSILHLNNVFYKYLTDFSGVDQEIIQAITPVKQFENLVHLKHFIDEVRNIPEKNSATIIPLFNLSRPSAYRKWIQSQSPANQLCLFVLWMLVETNTYALENDMERVYTIAEECITLPIVTTFGNRFAESLYDLVHNKNRIERNPNGTVDFIHPHLRNATKEFLSSGVPGIYVFLRNFLIRLINTDHPLEQSIASLICLFFRKQLGTDIEQIINSLLSSRFVQTIETVLRFGGIPLIISFLTDNADTNNIESKFGFIKRQFLYTPGQCQLDKNGYLVRKRRTYDNVILHNEIIEEMRTEIDLRLNQVSPQKQEFFMTLLEQENYNVLSSLERYEFAYWVFYNHGMIEQTTLRRLTRNLANDPISFVRASTKLFFDQENLLSIPEYQTSFQALCYDGHPNVKIEMLEDVILSYWRFMAEDVQDKWLQIVSDMLDDPIVRLHSSMGLIAQSGSLYYYHEKHDAQQKQKWFIALAPKLITYEFAHQVYFDRFLTPLDEYFVDLPLSFRTQLLASIVDYIEKYPSVSQDTLYSIEKIILKGNPTLQENEICLRLINNLSSWGKSRLCYSFAKNYQSLKDIRFRQFVHYPFYNESEFQYIAERAAALLGFRANSSLQLDDLPSVLDKNRTEPAINVIHEYWRQQNDDFKLLSVMMAHAYGAAHHIGAVYDDCFEFDIIDEMLEYFSRSSNVEKVRIIVEVVLNKVGLWEAGLQDKPMLTLMQSKWFERLKLFLYNHNPEIEKCVCELIFASNISSSAHSAKTFLLLVYLLLNHPNKSTADYALEFFEGFFYEFKNIMFDRDLPKSWKEEISDTWFSKEFQTKLITNSVVYKEWVQNIKFFNMVASGWLEHSDEHRESVISLMEAQLQQASPEIIDILIRFYYKIHESLPEQERERIENLLGIEQDHHSTKLSSERRIEAHKELNQFFARVNWDMYFDF